MPEPKIMTAAEKSKMPNWLFTLLSAVWEVIRNEFDAFFGRL